MIGSTFVYEPDEQKLLVLAEDLEALNDFVHVHMDILSTIDFEALVATSHHRWGAGEPVVYDADGLAVFSVAEDCLAFALSKTSELGSEQQTDLARLAAFLAKHGTSHIYEIATF